MAQTKRLLVLLALTKYAALDGLSNGEKLRLLLDRLAVEAKPLSPTRLATNTLINVGLVDPGPGARSLDPRSASSHGRANGGRANWGSGIVGGGSPQSQAAAALRRVPSHGGRASAPSAGGALGELLTSPQGGRLGRFAGSTLINVA